MLARLKNAIAPASRPLTLGGIVLPREAETGHMLLAGTTGSGKTTAIEELLDGIQARRERYVICDPNGSYFAQFATADDRLLNPFDARAERWSVFNELRRDYDAERLACSMVPNGQGESATWHGYAQTLLAELLRALMRSGEATTERLLYWASIAPPCDFAALLAGTPAAGLFDPEAAKALASTRFVLAHHLAPHRHVRVGEFSLRSWLENETGSLYVTWRADMQRALAPLVATWVDILVNAVLTLSPDRERRIWFVIDELAALGQLSSLESALTLGRKHGLALIAGLQSTAQLDRLYGRESAIVLRSCFRSLLVLGIAKADPDTAEVLSRALGEFEALRSEEGRAQGSQGNSRSVSARRVRERVLLPSEIASLPNLRGYLALAGAAPIAPIQLTPRRRAQVTEPYLEEVL